MRGPNRPQPGETGTSANPTLLLLAAVLGLAGCSSMPQPEEGYAATPPLTPRPRGARDGAIYSTGYDLALFSDRRANRVGDILTITLTESTEASKTATTSLSKSTDVSIPSPTFFGHVPRVSGSEWGDTSFGSEHEFDGEADATQENSLSGEITVTVAKVLPNGNLVVRGEKWLALNQGSEYIQIAGIVRPDDIGPDNSVPSTRVADARITYAGKGAPADSNRLGWLARFFVGLVFPF
jgi:flagellar L-ring protein precursor FlgH